MKKPIEGLGIRRSTHPSHFHKVLGMILPYLSMHILPVNMVNIIFCQAFKAAPGSDALRTRCEALLLSSKALGAQADQ